MKSEIEVECLKSETTVEHMAEYTPQPREPEPERTLEEWQTLAIETTEERDGLQKQLDDIKKAKELEFSRPWKVAIFVLCSLSATMSGYNLGVKVTHDKWVAMQAQVAEQKLPWSERHGRIIELKQSEPIEIYMDRDGGVSFGLGATLVPCPNPPQTPR